MKYLVKARLKESKRNDLLAAVNENKLGLGSVAFGEYVKNMNQARILEDGTVCWIEVCFCPTPLNEERPYWEEYFHEIVVKEAQDPKHCQDSNGEHKRACFECSCTEELEQEMSNWGSSFID